jgi:hypothetical protein
MAGRHRRRSRLGGGRGRRRGGRAGSERAGSERGLTAAAAAVTGERGLCRLGRGPGRRRRGGDRPRRRRRSRRRLTHRLGDRRHCRTPRGRLGRLRRRRRGHGDDCSHGPRGEDGDSVSGGAAAISAPPPPGPASLGGRVCRPLRRRQSIVYRPEFDS